MKNTTHTFRTSPVRSVGGFTFVKLILFLVIFGCVVSAAWVYFLPVVLTSALQKHTGFGVKVAELHFNPFIAKVDVSGLVLTNPESFPKREFMEVTSFSANAKMATLFSDRPEFDYARVEVAYVSLVRSADGVLNAQLFNDRLKKKAPDREAPVDSALTAPKQQPVNDQPATKGGPAPLPNATKVSAKEQPKDAKVKAKADELSAKDKKEKEAKTAEAEPVTAFLINRLELKLDKLIVADFVPATPDIREYSCKLYYTFNNVTDPKQLMAPFALKSLQSVGVALRALIPGGVGRAFGAVTQAPEPLIKPKDAQTEDPLKTVVEKLEETQKP
jgi:hypothetical protein